MYISVHPVYRQIQILSKKENTDAIMQRLLKGGEGMTSVPICSQSICNSPSSITGGNI